jgi:hypothetical protein
MSTPRPNPKIKISPEYNEVVIAKAIKTIESALARMSARIEALEKRVGAIEN